MQEPTSRVARERPSLRRWYLRLVLPNLIVGNLLVAPFALGYSVNKEHGVLSAWPFGLFSLFALPLLWVFGRLVLLRPSLPVAIFSGLAVSVLVPILTFTGTLSVVGGAAGGGILAGFRGFLVGGIIGTIFTTIAFPLPAAIAALNCWLLLRLRARCLRAGSQMASDRS